MDICIRVRETGEWASSPSRVLPAMRDAYANYKERLGIYQEAPYITGEYIVYRPDNDPYLPTYIARVNEIHPGAAGDGPNSGNARATRMTVSREVHGRLASSTPIIDMNDVMAFVVDSPAMSSANWVTCRAYQAWAFRDFIYDPHQSIKKSYMSLHTSYLSFTHSILANESVTIDLPDLSPNIVFNVSRNENNSVFFERNDARGSRIRMCDNDYARAGYLGYYTRLTMDVGIVVVPPMNAFTQQQQQPAASLLSTDHLPPPEETGDEGEQCILCNHNKINVKFSPCNHATCCYVCYSKLLKNECPICRGAILHLQNV